MIQYNVWFSFKPDTDIAAELTVLRESLDDYLAAERFHSYRLLRNRGDLSNGRLLPYQATIEFSDSEQFGRTFAWLRATNIHEGVHGRMIRFVDEVIVETFEDLV